MAKAPIDLRGPWPKGVSFSGRTVGMMFSKKKNQGSERLKLRAKNQLKPTGNKRFPNGKYFHDDGTPVIKT